MGAMAKNKTQKTEVKPHDFIDAVENEQRREDSREMLKLMQEITGKEPVMWGPSIIGFGDYHYKYESGREGDSFQTGFSPRKNALTLYIMAGFSRYEDLMENLGTFKTGKSCLYLKRLDDVDRDVLKELISGSVQFIRDRYPEE